MGNSKISKTMKATKKLTFLFSLFMLVSSVYGQSSKRLKEFSSDNSVYIEELYTFILTGSASEDTKKLMKKFNKMWDGKTFSSDKKSSIISNLIVV